MEKTIARRAQQCLFAAAAATILCSAAEARSLRTVHVFTGPDGASAAGGLAVGANGNLFGTTITGGFDAGTIFTIARRN